LEAFLEVKDVSRSFGKQQVLQGVSLSIPAGRIVALLGPNGAGKSTLNRILRGELAPHGGQVKVFGQALGTGSLPEGVGILLQQTGFPRVMKVKEALSLTASHFHDPLPIAELLHSLHMKPIHHRSIGELSGGQARLVAFVQALVGRPKLLLLDEPTTGIDLETKSLVWQHLKNFRSQGGSILLATHDMDEAEQLCDDVLLIEQGRVRFNGDVESFRRLVGGKLVRFRAAKLQGLETYSLMGTTTGHFEGLVLDSDRFVKDLVQSGTGFSDLTIQKISLGAAFVSLLNSQNLTRLQGAKL
jgi:ABC-2 type transport system ATP-binding protein